MTPVNPHKGPALALLWSPCWEVRPGEVTVPCPKSLGCQARAQPRGPGAVAWEPFAE